MKALIIESKGDTPKIHLDKQNNNFEIAGCSLPEDSNSFYSLIYSYTHYQLESLGNLTKW